MTPRQEAANTACGIAMKLQNKMLNKGNLKKECRKRSMENLHLLEKTGCRSKYVQLEKPTRREKQSMEERTKEISLCSLELESLTAQSANNQKEQMI